MIVSDLQILIRAAALLAAIAFVMMAANPASAMGPGNLMPNLTFPEKGTATDETLSTKNAPCGLFGCKTEK